MAYGLSNGVTSSVTWPRKVVEAVRSAFLGTAWLLVLFVAVFQLFYICYWQWLVQWTACLWFFFSYCPFQKWVLKYRPIYTFYLCQCSRIKILLCIHRYKNVVETWKIRLAVKLAVNLSAEIQPKKMWLAGFSAEFLLSQPKLNKNSAEGSNGHTDEDKRLCLNCISHILNFVPVRAIKLGKLQTKSWR